MPDTTTTPRFTTEIAGHYAQGVEAGRLESSSGHPWS